jgi:hypothetical protein
VLKCSQLHSKNLPLLIPPAETPPSESNRWGLRCATCF